MAARQSEILPNLDSESTFEIGESRVLIFAHFRKVGYKTGYSIEFLRLADSGDKMFELFTTLERQPCCGNFIVPC